MSSMNMNAPADCFVVRVPMTFKRRGGRKEIVLPDRGGPVSVKGLPRDVPVHPLLVALARAHRWQAMIESGQFPSVTALADALGVHRTYVTRVLNLTGLAPDIVEDMLRGEEPDGSSIERLQGDIPVSWDEQRARLRGGSSS